MGIKEAKEILAYYREEGAIRFGGRAVPLYLGQPQERAQEIQDKCYKDFMMFLDWAEAYVKDKEKENG